MRRSLLSVLMGTFALVLVSAAPALADGTLFLGTSPTPANRAVTGGAIGVGLLVIGFEGEYASTSEDTANGAPSLKTGMANVLVQTPTTGLQLYGTIGAGLYHEALGEVGHTNVGTNVGGGVKIRLVGPIRLRLDIRVFHLQGGALYKNPKRFYAGVNLAF